ncbi:MAG: TolC family protein [Gemmatimonadales bacterium]|jgi:outer membrane protein TolC|nr:MAG: TolC family protein [Gemmatimonadales bacterium]
MKCSSASGALVTALVLSLPCGLVAQDTVQVRDSLQVQVETYVFGYALPPLEAGAVPVEMSLEEAIARALEVNLNVQSARLSPVIQDYALRVAQAAFATTVSGTYGYNNATSLSTSQLDGGNQTNTVRQTFNTSIAKPMPWYGGRFSVNFNNSRTQTDNSFATRNPSFSSQVNLSYTQPLLAGFKTDNQRAAVQTQTIQAQITDLQVLSQVEGIVGQVQEAYWALRAAIEQIEIQRRSLAEAEQLVEQNRIRLQLGRGTQYQVIQSQAQLASAQQALLNAEVQWRNREFAFKQLILGGATDPLLYETINPVDLPSVTPPSVDIQAAVATALDQRTDIRQQRQQQRISEVNLAVTRNGRLPDLNLTASYALQGVGGDLFDRSGLGGDPVLVQQGGYFDGLNSIADFEAPTWSLQLQASYPIGNTADEANLERARLQLRQQELALREQELAIVTQVTNSGLAVDNTFLQYQAAQRSREAAELNAAAEQVRFNVGAATNFELVAAQNQVTSARLAELQALIAHLNAAAAFERIQRVGS